MGPDRVALVGLVVATTFALVAEGVVNVNLMPYAMGLGVPAAGLGVVFTAHRLARILASPWVGLAADRVGRRPLLLGGIFCASLGLALLALAGSFWPLLAARVLYGLASALIVTCGMASVIDLSGPSDRGRTLGFYQAALYGVYPLGSVAGGFLVDGLGYARTFVSASAVVLASLGLAAVTVRETRAAGPGAGRSAAAIGLRDYPRLLAGPIGRYVALKMLSGFAIWGVFEATLVLFLLAVLGQQATLLGTPLGTRSLAGILLGSILLVGFLLGSPVVGRWADRTGGGLPLVAVSLALTALALLGLAAAASAEAIALAVLGLGGAVALVSAPLAALVGNAAPAEGRAATMAAYSTLSDLANSLGSILGAALALGVGYRPTYVATGCLVAVGGAVLFARRASGGRRG